MNPYLSITIRTFTIWIMTAIINGVLCGTYLIVSAVEPEPFLLIIFFATLFFSIPGFFIFWIVMLIAISRNIYGRALFRTALSTALLLSAATGVVGSGLSSIFTLLERCLFPVFIIISSIAGIMMHFNLFKKIEIQKTSNSNLQTASQ